MIKSSMDFFDVLFPLNLSPLSYRCPEELLKFIEPGMIVSAPIKNKIAKGIIIGTSPEIPSGDVKDIQKIHGNYPFLSTALINLLKWMSEYYLAEKGIVLKNMLPKEAFTKVKKRKTKILPSPPSLDTVDISNSALSNLMVSINKGAYKTFLLHAPSSAYERSFVIKILSDTMNTIILIPEVSQIDAFYSLLHKHFGERVCPLHSGLSRGKKSEAIEKILSGISDIVIGTRSAIFAPLKKVSFIAVLNEHSSSYKQKEGFCYSGRDVAVMRGYLEKATVLLSSFCPSIESFYNCRKDKYTLIKPEEVIQKPRIKVIDLKHEKLLKPYLSRTVIDVSSRYMKNNRKVMFLINRRGYSTLLQCSDCNYIEECPQCRIPMVLHKTGTGDGHSSRILKCHYCGYISNVPERCHRCKGYRLEFLGAGTQRVQEDIEEFIGIKTLRVDSDISLKKSDLEGLIDAMHRDDVRIIIGTKLMTKRLGITKGFYMAAILNADLLMNFPDFRSTEKTYQEISSIIEKIEPQGEILIQTRMPQNHLFKCLKNYDYNYLFREELIKRKPLNYPPYSRLLHIRFISQRDLSKKLSGIIEKKDKGVEILGPSVSKNTKGKFEFKLLLKSSVRGSLHSAARTLIESFKDSKDVKIKIDVDPVSI
jgi:primosomal protein N' (replication factor Y)